MISNLNHNYLHQNNMKFDFFYLTDTYFFMYYVSTIHCGSIHNISIVSAMDQRPEILPSVCSCHKAPNGHFFFDTQYTQTYHQPANVISVVDSTSNILYMQRVFHSSKLDICCVREDSLERKNPSKLGVFSFFG